MREAIDFLAERKELVLIKNEVDPEYQIAGIQKALDNGPAFLFENIKGYPGVRDIGNLFARRERVAAMFGLDDHRQLKFGALRAIKSPVAPKVVANPPCQQVVITDDIDIAAVLPFIKHSEDDAGRILGGG